MEMETREVDDATVKKKLIMAYLIGFALGVAGMFVAIVVTNKIFG